MAEPKTKPTKQSVASFFKSLDPQVRQDCLTIAKLMEEATGSKPKMWGSAIVGFGSQNYKYASGREGDWPVIGFSPRKQNLTLYIMSGFDEQAELLKKLGKHTTGGSCLYIKSLSDIDLSTLKKLIRASVKKKKKAASATLE
jgi:hypothetical protein